MENSKIKEIELIQKCINKMSRNSFIAKGWLISLIAVILILLPEKFEVKWLCIIGLLITACFWYLDAYFSKIEKLYIWKYDWVLSERAKTDKYMYDLNPYNADMWLPDEDGSNKKAPKETEVMFSNTLVRIYMPIIVLILIIFIHYA